MTAAPVLRARGAAAAAAISAAAAAGAACAPRCDVPVCDIRESSCQRAVADATACLRGVDRLEIPVSLVKQSDLLAEAERSASTMDEDQKKQFRHFIEGLALLKLAPMNLDPGEAARQDAAWVAAWYDSDAKSITVVNAGENLDSPYHAALLVHEYTHAIQDRATAFRGYFERHGGSLDRLLAAGSVIEGEATVVEDLSLVALWGTDSGALDWSAIIGKWQERARQAAFRSPLPVLLAPAHFQYAFGTGLVQRAFGAGGWEAVDKLRGGPPVGTNQVLAGPGAAEPSGRGWFDSLEAEAVPELPPRFALVATERFGAWILQAFLGRITTPALATQIAPALRDDRLSVWRDTESDTPVVAWRFRFADDASRDSFLRATTPNTQPGAARRKGADVLLVAATVSDTIELVHKAAFVPAPGAMDPATKPPRPLTRLRPPGIACPRKWP